MNRADKLYQQEFGNIPNTQIDRIGYILGNRVKNEKYNQYIAKEAKKIKRIKWKTVTFVMWRVIKPSARPRANTRAGYIHMYVPHAKENGDWFADYYKNHDLPFISTPCELHMKIYEKTPSSFNIKNKVLAELGFIKPWKRTGDFDNYAKGIADMIQHGMLEDDCLVIKSSQELFYSIKPHCEVTIKYMEKFPEV